MTPLRTTHRELKIGLVGDVALVDDWREAFATLALDLRACGVAAKLTVEYFGLNCRPPDALDLVIAIPTTMHGNEHRTSTIRDQLPVARSFGQQASRGWTEPTENG